MARELSRRPGRELMARSLSSMFPPLREQMERMSRMVDEFFGPMEGMRSAMWSPSLDITETEDKVTATVELPGIRPEDMDISISDNILTIRGEKREERKAEEGYAYCCERQYGEFRRSVELPSSVNSERVNATYRNGILTIEMPKSEEMKRKKISIRAE
ncbi:MAG: Hsp20/alpha crystallin family protein [bacterium]